MQMNKPCASDTSPSLIWVLVLSQCSRSKSGRGGDPSCDGAGSGWAAGKDGLQVWDKWITSLGTKQLLTASWRTLDFPMRLFTLLSVNKIWIFFFWVYGKNILYMCLCVCLCFKDKTQKLTVQRGVCTSIHETLLWSRKAWGSFTCRRSHQFFSSIPCTQTDKILAMDLQIQSCSALSSGPFWKVAIWNNPEIANLPANSSTALSQIPRH